MMQYILKLRDEDKLGPALAAWFKTKPVEELYDVEQDPYELHNLAEDPQYAGKLAGLRAALQEWTKKYGDMGAIPEEEMLRQMWNGGNMPPATAAPEVIKESGGVRITCGTMSASIGYYISREGKPASQGTHRVRSWDVESLMGAAKPGDERPAPEVWSVYDGEVIPFHVGDTLYVNAMRIGYTPALITYRDGKVTVVQAPKS